MDAEVSTEQDEVLVERISMKKHPHVARRKEIIGRHPEISACMGANPWSFVYTVALVTSQLALGVVLKDSNWWVIFGMSYGVGAVIDHALYVLIHDAGHNLFFKKVVYNRLSLLVANLPHVLPSAILFRFYHIQHHIELNKPAKDPDVPMEWEANWVGNSAFRKAFWLANFAIFQSVRSLYIVSAFSPLLRFPRSLVHFASQADC